jgi:hypothetical protein
MRMCACPLEGLGGAGLVGEVLQFTLQVQYTKTSGHYKYITLLLASRNLQ